MINKVTSDSRWKYWGKRGGIALTIIIGILLLVQILFSLFAKSYLKQQFISAVERADPDLKVKISSLSLFTVTRQIEFENIRVWRSRSKSQNTKNALARDSLSIRSITASGIHFFNLLFNQKLILNRLSVDKTDVYTQKKYKCTKEYR